MTGASRRAALVLSALLGSAIACAGRPPRPYDFAVASAERARNAGRLDEAAREYERAAGLARRDLDHDEAIYRAAQAWRRAGQTQRALALFDSLRGAAVVWGRDARAPFEAARLRVETGDVARGERELENVVVRFPNSGPGRRAVDWLLRLHDDRDPSGASAIAWLERIAPHTERTLLRSSIAWERARRLERAGRDADAVRAYEALLTQPYPQNSHLDDGTLQFARLLLRLNRAPEVVAIIERTLAVHEQPALPLGSYTRTHFARLGMLRAETLRDVLHDDRRAANAFREVHEWFSQSLMRDDAMFAESELRERLGEHERACALRERLARDYACSRFGRRARDALPNCGMTPLPEWERPCVRRPIDESEPNASARNGPSNGRDD